MVMETKEDAANWNWEKPHEHFPSLTPRTWWPFAISIFFELPGPPKDSDYLRKRAEKHNQRLV